LVSFRVYPVSLLVRTAKSKVAVLYVKGGDSTGGNGFSRRNRQFLWLPNGLNAGILKRWSAAKPID
jgi:hypothetical protein